MTDTPSGRNGSRQGGNGGDTCPEGVFEDGVWGPGGTSRREDPFGAKTTNGQDVAKVDLKEGTL